METSQETVGSIVVIWKTLATIKTTRVEESFLTKLQSSSAETQQPATRKAISVALSFRQNGGVSRQKSPLSKRYMTVRLGKET